jgi:WD40 repeat protein
LSPDGTSTTEASGRVASASWDATIKIWNSTTGDVLSTMTSGIGNALYCMSALFEDDESNDNALVAVGTRQCEVQEWSLQTNQRVHTYLGHGKEVHPSLARLFFALTSECLVGSLCGLVSNSLH